MKKFLSKWKAAGIVLGGLAAVLLTSCAVRSKQAVHGEKLLELSDDQLFETVYLQTLDLVDSYGDEAAALEKISPACRTFYILSIFDMEIQNGGLCQFFVNSSRALAPEVDGCLEAVGAEEHRQLFASFVADNQIDLRALDSFAISSIEEYAARTERYDFEGFDSAYYALPHLQDYLTAYIKANIAEF